MDKSKHKHTASKSKRNAVRSRPLPGVKFTNFIKDLPQSNIQRSNASDRREVVTRSIAVHTRCEISEEK